MVGTTRRGWAATALLATAMAVGVLLLVRSRSEGDRVGAELGWSGEAAAGHGLRPTEPQAVDFAAAPDATGADAVSAPPARVALAAAVLSCRVQDADGVLAPVASGALVVRSGGALRLVEIAGGEASTAGLSADASVVSACVGDVDVELVRAPAEPSRGGEVVLAFAEGLSLHVRDAVTRQALGALQVHVRDGAERDLSSLGLFEDVEAHGLPLGGSRVVASGVPPLSLPKELGRTEIWIEAPTHGVHRAWIDASAPEACVWVVASGTVEASVPVEARHPDCDGSPRPDEPYAPGYYVVCEPSIGGPWRLWTHGADRRGGVRPGVYEAWLVPLAEDGPRAPTARARFEVIAGQTTTIDFRVLEPSERATGTLRIVVRGGDPSLSAVVHARCLESAPAWTISRAINAHRFEDAGGGRHVLELVDARVGRWLVGDARTRARDEVVVPAGGTVEAVLDVGAARRLDVEVVGGGPYARVYGGDELEPRLEWHSARVTDGRALLHLVPGAARVSAQDAVRSVDAVVDSAHTDRLRLVLPEAGGHAWYALEFWHGGRRLSLGQSMALAFHDAAGAEARMSWSPSPEPSRLRVLLPPGEYTLRHRPSPERVVGSFVADPACPNVLVELRDDAPLDLLVAR